MRERKVITRSAEMEDVVVKEEMEEPSEETCENTTTEKNEYSGLHEAGSGRDGRRRQSRRLLILEKEERKKATKYSVDAEEEKQRRRRKLQRKYQRRKQRRSEMTPEERAIANEKARQSYRAAQRRLKGDNYRPREFAPSSSGCFSKGEGGGGELTKEEVKKERKMREKFKRIVKLAEMSEEELHEHKMAQFLQRQAWKASKSKDEMKAMYNKRYARTKKLMKEDEDYRKHFYERARKWRAGLSEEKRERYMGSVKKAMKKYISNLKVKNPEKHRENYGKLLVKLRERTANETPEKRQQRLLKYKVNAAKRKLKAKLEGEGIAPEVIVKRLEELAEEMRKQPLPPPSEYKPRFKKAAGMGEDVEDGGNKKTENLEDASTVSEEVGAVLYCYQEGEGVEFVQNVDSSGGIVLTALETNCMVRVLSSESLPPENLIIVSSMEVKSDHFNEVDIISDNLSQPSSPPCIDDDSYIEPPPESVTQLLQPAVTSIDDNIPNKECPQCPESFLDDSLLRNHLATCHLFTCWKCPLCFQVLLSPSELTPHFQQTHVEGSTTGGSNGKFICMRCPFTLLSVDNKFESLTQLKDHVRRKHHNSFWPCNDCGILKYSKYRLDFHQRHCFATPTTTRICSKKIKKRGS